MQDTVVRAFSADHVARLTGLSKGQLAYWDATGFSCPNYAFENRHSPYSRVYSFRDVAGLRTLALLRNQYRVSLQHLRKVAERLSHLGESLWSETVLYVFRGEVHFTEPETSRIRGIVSKQYVNIALRRIIDDVSAAASKLRERSADQIGRIERHRFVVHNAWVVSGTRIPVAAIRRFREAGYSVSDIRREYPTLTNRDVEAAVEHEPRRKKRA